MEIWVGEVFYKIDLIVFEFKSVVYTFVFLLGVWNVWIRVKVLGWIVYWYEWVIWEGEVEVVGVLVNYIE